MTVNDRSKNVYIFDSVYIERNSSLRGHALKPLYSLLLSDAHVRKLSAFSSPNQNPFAPWDLLRSATASPELLLQDTLREVALKHLRGLKTTRRRLHEARIRG